MKLPILILFLLTTATAYQQISGEFSQKWISDFKAQNPETLRELPEQRPGLR